MQSVAQRRTVQQLINVRTGDVHAWAITFVMAAFGWTYVTNLVPIYRPEDITSPFALFIGFLLMAVSGGVIVVALIAAAWDRVWALALIILGLSLQSFGLLQIAVIGVLSNGPERGAWVVLCLGVVTAHSIKIYCCMRELNLARGKEDQVVAILSMAKRD